MPTAPRAYRPAGSAHRQRDQARERMRHYDARRGSAAARGYGWRWQTYSTDYRRKHPLCVSCLAGLPARRLIASPSALVAAGLMRPLGDRGLDAWLAEYARVLSSLALDVDASGQAELTQARQVDHVHAVDGPNDPMFWPSHNHQSLCEACHARKTRAENATHTTQP